MVARGGVHHGGTCTAEQCRLRQCELILLSARLHEASFSCHFFTFLWSTDSKGRGRSGKEREKEATVPLQPAVTRCAVGISITEQLVSLSSEFVTCAFRAPQLSRAFFCGATHCVSVPSLQKSVCCPVCWYPLLRYTHDVSFLSSSRVHLATVVLHTLRVSPVFSMRLIGWLTLFESRFVTRFCLSCPV